MASGQKQIPRAKGRPWSAEEVSVLGTMSDAQASRLLMRSVDSVRTKREVLNRPPFRPALTEQQLISLKKSRTARDFPWTKDEDFLLGKFTDREVSKKLNRTLLCVRGRRKFLGIPAVGRDPQPKWAEIETEAHYAHLFATKTDKEIRGILGWSYKRIQTTRQQVGRSRRKYPEWSLQEDKSLASKPDGRVAASFARTPAAVRARRGTKRVRVQKPWRPEDDAVLGTRPDVQIAKLLGRSIGNVSWRRKKLGISPKAMPKPWTQEQDNLLGSKPDAELAVAFNRTFAAVQARRNELGIPKFGTPFHVVKVMKPGGSSENFPQTTNIKSGAAYCTWTPEEDALLGQITDQEIAAKLGYSIARIRRRRHLLGLKNPNPDLRHWTAEEIALLGTRPDREVAPLVKRSVSNVRYKRLELGIPFRNPSYEVWKPDELELLGNLTDEEVARRTGHSLSTRQARRSRRIVSAEPPAPPWRPEEDALLGTAPDKDIAIRVNRSVGAVRLRRRKKSVPPA